LASDVIQLVFDGLTSGSIYALVAVGFAFLFATGRYVNFAHGDWAMFSGMAAASVTGSVGLAVGVLVAPALGAALAVVTYEVFLRRARSRDVLTVALLLLALGLILQWAALRLWGAQPRAIASLAQLHPIRVADAALSGSAAVTIGASVVALGVVFMLLRFTRLGHAATAWADNPEAAALSGIDIHRVVRLSFALAGALAGVAGLMLACLAGLSFQSGLTITIKAFGAAAIGGFHDPARAALGGLILGLVEAIAGTYIGGAYTDVSSLVLVAIFVAVVVPRTTRLVPEASGEVAGDAANL
jgi:branched-chain amino acid transport system permease protein